VEAQDWLDQVTASIISGTYVDPRTARTTVAAWCQMWLAGYATRRPSTVRQARVHIAQIIAEFGAMPLAAVRPSHVKAWTSRLREQGMSASYVYALHARLAQIFADAVHDGIVPRSPCSRRTSPGLAPARLRRHDQASVGAARCDACPVARSRPARRVRRAAGGRGLRAKAW
jgi:hypothetical protein